MKKSRIEDVLIEEENNRSNKKTGEDIYSMDSKDINIVDLTDVETEDDDRYEHENILKSKISSWYKDRVEKRKKRRRGKGKLRRICTILVCSLVITIIAISLWNAAQMKQISDIRSSIDETYNAQQVNTDCVERLGNLFTIHNEETFNWCMDNIDMTNDVKSKLFTPDSDGKFTYTGQEMKGNPSFQCTEIMFANQDDPLEYLAQFRVVLANGNVRYFFVICTFREQFNKMVLTSIYIY